MSKKNIIVIIVIVLVLIIGGIFWECQRPNSQFEKLWTEKIEMGGSIRDFSIKKTIIENTREKWTVKIPIGWKAEKAKTIFFSEWGVNLSSPDIKFTSNNLFLEQGCIIKVNMQKSNSEFEITKSLIEKAKTSEEKLPTLEEDLFEIIEVYRHPAVKEAIIHHKLGIEIEVRIPIKDDKNIYFVLYSPIKNQERCFQEFDKFLEAVVIQ